MEFIFLFIFEFCFFLVRISQAEEIEVLVLCASSAQLCLLRFSTLSRSFTLTIIAAEEFYPADTWSWALLWGKKRRWNKKRKRWACNSLVRSVEGTTAICWISFKVALRQLTFSRRHSLFASAVSKFFQLFLSTIILNKGPDKVLSFHPNGTITCCCCWHDNRTQRAHNTIVVIAVANN